MRRNAVKLEAVGLKANGVGYGNDLSTKIL